MWQITHCSLSGFQEHMCSVSRAPCWLQHPVCPSVAPLWYTSTGVWHVLHFDVMPETRHVCNLTSFSKQLGASLLHQLHVDLCFFCHSCCLSYFILSVVIFFTLAKLFTTVWAMHFLKDFPGFLCFSNFLCTGNPWQQTQRRTGSTRAVWLGRSLLTKWIWYLLHNRHHRWK